jgi:hypothetical protein
MHRTLALFVLAVPLTAQEALTLRRAVDLALQSHPLVAAADAGEKEGEARIRHARSGYLPRIHFSESLQRGNNPVFVFSSLLNQRQFSQGNFSLASLNRPDALNNYQSRLTVEQVLFDSGQTSRGVEAARPIVWKAVCCHQTQLSIYERLADLTEEQQTALWGTQEFYRVYSSVNGGRKRETDLSEGVR